MHLTAGGADQVQRHAQIRHATNDPQSELRFDAGLDRGWHAGDADTALREYLDQGAVVAARHDVRRGSARPAITRRSSVPRVKIDSA